MTTLAGAPGSCCFTTVQHVGEPKGVVEDLGGAPTYISEPTEMTTPKRVVLFFADVYGAMFINNKLMQDFFASQGKLTFSD